MVNREGYFFHILCALGCIHLNVKDCLLLFGTKRESGWRTGSFTLTFCIFQAEVCHAIWQKLTLVYCRRCEVPSHCCSNPFLHYRSTLVMTSSLPPFLDVARDICWWLLYGGEKLCSSERQCLRPCARPWRGLGHVCFWVGLSTLKMSRVM